MEGEGVQVPQLVLIEPPDFVEQEPASLLSELSTSEVHPLKQKFFAWLHYLGRCSLHHLLVRHGLFLVPHLLMGFRVL